MENSDLVGMTAGEKADIAAAGSIELMDKKATSKGIQKKPFLLNKLEGLFKKNKPQEEQSPRT